MSVKHPDAQTSPLAKQMREFAQTNSNGVDTEMWEQGCDESNEIGSQRYGKGKSD